MSLLDYTWRPRHDIAIDPSIKIGELFWISWVLRRINPPIRGRGCLHIRYRHRSNKQHAVFGSTNPATEGFARPFHKYASLGPKFLLNLWFTCKVIAPSVYLVIGHIMAISSLFPQLFAGSFLVLICLLLKRRYLTSIRDIPGPFFASFTGAWQVYKLIKGDQHVDMIKLHRRYGKRKHKFWSSYH